MKVRDLWKVMDREDGQKIYVYEAGIEKDLVASMDKEVAHLMNVTRECVTMWEKGVRTPDVISLARLCRILKVTIYDVIDNLI